MHWAVMIFGMLVLIVWAGLVAALMSEPENDEELAALKHKPRFTKQSPWEQGLGEVFLTLIFIPLTIIFFFRPEFVFSVLGAFIAFCFLLSWKDKRPHFRFSLQRLFVSALTLSTSIGYTIYIWNADFRDIWGL